MGRRSPWPLKSGSKAGEVFVRAFPSRSRDGVKIIASYGGDKEPAVFESGHKGTATFEVSEIYRDE
jgi:hypothetical protein